MPTHVIVELFERGSTLFLVGVALYFFVEISIFELSGWKGKKGVSGRMLNSRYLRHLLSCEISRMKENEYDEDEVGFFASNFNWRFQ